eukprot:COSAG05_NODE_3730_length_1876_cov_4.429375_3_plen_47_part_00
MAVHRVIIKALTTCRRRRRGRRRRRIAIATAVAGYLTVSPVGRQAL